MKTSSILILGTLLISQAFAESKGIRVIYGEDNRKDVFETTNPSFLEMAKSTAAMIEAKGLKTVGSEVHISAATLADRGICKTERFAQQISAANCSGFLVAANKLVTAGHCITSEADCKAQKWVFDYKVNSANQGTIKVPSTSVYGCKKIISRALDNPRSFGNSPKNDYAIIELDRSVTDRFPVKIRGAGTVSKGDALVVIGHPSGLPTKIADGANVRSLSGKYFTANLDTYGGNSGSAVFNVKTEEVEGILVRGENDYVDGPNGCQVSNRCKIDGCRGEDVTYIKNVPGL